MQIKIWIVRTENEQERSTLLWTTVNVWTLLFYERIGSTHSGAEQCSSEVQTRFQCSLAESLQNKTKHSTILSAKEYHGTLGNW